MRSQTMISRVLAVFFFLLCASVLSVTAVGGKKPPPQRAPTKAELHGAISGLKPGNLKQISWGAPGSWHPVHSQDTSDMGGFKLVSSKATGNPEKKYHVGIARVSGKKVSEPLITASYKGYNGGPPSGRKMKKGLKKAIDAKFA